MSARAGVSASSAAQAPAAIGELVMVGPLLWLTFLWSMLE